MMKLWTQDYYCLSISLLIITHQVAPVLQYMAKYIGRVTLGSLPKILIIVSINAVVLMPDVLLIRFNYL